MQEQVYEYGCVMAGLYMPNHLELLQQIDTNDVYLYGDKRYGLEHDPHITVLYGLHSNEIKDSEITKLIRTFNIIKDIKLTGISCFETDEYDVLKFDVESETLVKMNSEFKKFPYTSSYPKYHPHLTIAYLNKGCGAKYHDTLEYDNDVLESHTLIYSKPNSEKLYYFLK